jgi:hypothetical protein
MTTAPCSRPLKSRFSIPSIPTSENGNSSGMPLSHEARATCQRDTLNMPNQDTCIMPAGYTLRGPDLGWCMVAALGWLTRRVVSQGLLDRAVARFVGRRVEAQVQMPAPGGPCPTVATHCQ